jgi:hypothetical protein
MEKYRGVHFEMLFSVVKRERIKIASVDEHRAPTTTSPNTLGDRKEGN